MREANQPSTRDMNEILDTIEKTDLGGGLAYLQDSINRHHDTLLERTIFLLTGSYINAHTDGTHDPSWRINMLIEAKAYNIYIPMCREMIARLETKREQPNMQRRNL